MSINSVNTNQGAIVALQNLNKTNAELATVQKRVSTGLRVADAVDDGAAFAVAQSLRSEQGALGAVNSQLSVAKGAMNVFSTAATKVSETLAKGKEVLLKLADSSLSTEQRDKYNADFAALKAEVTNYIDNAKFNGKNLLDGTDAKLSVVANSDGTQYDIGTGSAYELQTEVDAAFATVADATAAKTLLAGGFATAETSVGTVLNSMGSDIRRIDNQMKFNSAVQDALETSVGAIVDADLAKESARLQSLQIKQQLGSSALGIANQSPSILASLFR